MLKDKPNHASKDSILSNMKGGNSASSSPHTRRNEGQSNERFRDPCVPDIGMSDWNSMNYLPTVKNLDYLKNKRSPYEVKACLNEMEEKYSPI